MTATHANSDCRMPGIKHRRPGDEDHVDARQYDEYYHDDHQHVVNPGVDGINQPARHPIQRNPVTSSDAELNCVLPSGPP